MKDFSKRISSIEPNRQMENVYKLRELIRDMYKDGYTSIGIGRALDKDHTTILHHLTILGLSTKKNWEAFRHEGKMADALIKLKQKEQKNKQLKHDRELVMELYKKGASYKMINEVTGFGHTRIQSLLQYCDEYLKIKNTRTPNTPRSVRQLTKEGKKIKDWPSISNAASALDLQKSGIVFTCQGRISTCGGYKWEYLT